MKILVIANNFPWPGHRFDGMFNLRHVKALEARGHQVRVLRFVPWLPPFTRYGKIFAGLPRQYQIEEVPVRIARGVLAPRRYGIGTLRLQLGAFLRKEAAAFDPDIVHAHGLLDAGLLATTIARPLVVTAHGSEAYRLPWLRPGLRVCAEAVVQKATAMVAVSEFVASHVRKLGRRDVDVIFNGADERVFHSIDRDAARAALGIDRNRPVILYAGQLVQEKGLAELAAAVAQLKALQPQLIVAGAGTQREGFANDLRSREVDARFLGTVDQSALATAMAASDVFTLPSYAEGLPTVICEAMNAGRAVVATRVGGIPEIVRDGVTGFVVAPHAADALADSLRTVLMNEQLRRTFEENAKAYAQTHLTWSINAQAYERLYSRVLSTRDAYSTTYGKTIAEPSAGR